MSIASEITKLNTNLTNSYTACENKGATLPASQNFDNLASTISAIPAGTEPTLASLTVTPSTTAQTLTPPSGTDGYNTVSVSAVTASIDSDIVAGNIKSGCNILGVNGTVTELVGSTTTITTNGTYTPSNGSNGFTSVSVNVAGTQPSGTYTIIQNGTYDVTNYASADVSVSGGGSTKYGATGGTFLGDVDANGVLSYDSNTPTDLVFTGVRDLGDYALYLRFTYIATNSSVSLARFTGLSSIRSVSFPDLENISGSFAMHYAFVKCPNLMSVDLSSLTTVSKNSMVYAFYECASLTNLDLSNLTTVSGNMQHSFYGCTSLTGTLDLSNLTTISGKMLSTFHGCTGLTSVDLSSLTTISGQQGFQSTFHGCTGLTSVSFPSLSTIDSLNGYAMQYAFRDCTSLTTLSFPALTSTSFGSYTNQFSNMLRGVTGCTVHFPSNLQSVIGSWSDVTGGFDGTNTTVLFDLPATT